LQQLTPRDIAQIGLFAGLMAVGAFVTVPLGPVPFTLQVFAVLLTGLVLGSRAAARSVMVYLLLGLVAPVYAGATGGFAVLLGPTGGYLIGFLPATAIAGLSRRYETGWSGSLGIALLGLAALYAVGASWLALQLHLDTLSSALTTGVFPFLPFDVAKTLLAVAVARGLLNLPLGLPGLPEER
jgi:biotin transport system substrate-specific component